MKNLTPLGWVCSAAAGALLMLILWKLSACLWWVGVGEEEADFLGWCWGTMTECVKL